jgi:ABC-2 type transport system ATP-binding protein
VAAVIEVRDLAKTYPDGTQAVKGVTFTVAKGEIFGFLGPNGAGKTSTMRILGTLQDATAGTARVLGLDVKKDAAEVKRRIGFAMQEVGMDDLATAREMLLFHARLYGIHSQEAARRADRLLQDFGLAPHADRRVTRFSGGMQRRLDLAVSLIHTPEVLFLDEPSTGLDPKSRSDLWKVLRGLRDEQGITILMSTHYMDEADALCDRIAVINKGRVVAIDTPENLKRSVGADTLLLTVGEVTPPQWQRLQQAFRPANVRLDGDQLAIRVRDGATALMPALQVVTDAGVLVKETKVRTPTLEDVFLKYTGATFADAAQSADKNGLDANGAAPGKRRRRGGNVKISDERVDPEAGQAKTAVPA